MSSRSPVRDWLSRKHSAVGARWQILLVERPTFIERKPTLDEMALKKALRKSGLVPIVSLALH